MAEGGKPANDLAPNPVTVTDQVFENFYKRMEETDGLQDVAKRFRATDKRTREALEKIIFGEDSV